MSELSGVGPKMAALWDDRVRTFAVLMAGGAESATEAAREAGYSDAGEGCKVRASELMARPEVREAIEEASRNCLQWLAPRAIAAAKAILGDPRHKQHARMIEVVLDRTGFFAKTEHKVTVEHTVGLKELEDLARRLALENGIAPEKFIGISDASNGPVIEGEATEVADAAQADG